MVELLTFILLLGSVELNTALKCYSGSTQEGKAIPGMEVKEVTCNGFGMNECASVEYSMTLFGKDLKVITAMCGSKASQCKMCQHLEGSIPGMKNCQANCCDSDLCNNKVIETLTTDFDKKDETAESKKNVTCYVGQHIKNPFLKAFNKHEVILKKCPDTTQCVTADYKMKMMNTSIPVVQGMCGQKYMDCSLLCPSLEKNLPLTYCQADCCDGEKCNIKVGQYYHGEKGNKEKE